MSDMHWFRWHHGTVSDPKLSLVARLAGASLAEAVAVWAWLLEAASQAEERGNPGRPDFDVVEHCLGLQQGRAEALYSRMVERGMIAADGGALTAWSRRQPKRERDGDLSTDRVREHRARKRGDKGASPRNEVKRPETPRGEEIRADQSLSPPPPSTEGERATTNALHQDAERAAAAMQSAGLSSIKASRPELSAWLSKGVTVDQLADAAREAVTRGARSPVAYAFTVIADRVAAAATVVAGAALPVAAWDSGRSSIEAKGVALGLGRWDEGAYQVGSGEAFAAYTARVRAAVEASGVPA